MRPLGTFRSKEVKRIVDQVPGLKRAVLHGIGEPLLNEGLPQMIRHLKGRGVYVLFNSNALLLSTEWAKRLIASGLDEFRVSLDAATEFTYSRLRSSNNFSRVTANVEALIRMKRKSNRSTPTVSAWLVGSQANMFDFPDLIRLASQIGIDEVYLQRLVYPLDGPGHGLACREQTIRGPSEQIRNILAEATSLSRALGVRLMASGLAAPSESLRPKPRE